MKTILVTGGAGFIGTNLCGRLLEDGHRVICLDDYSTGSKKNLESLISSPGFSCYVEDVRTSWEEGNGLLEHFPNGLDEIYNLACPASPPAYQRDPLKTLRTNVIGMDNMLALATKFGAKILQASTSEVYGDPLEHPQKETYWGNVNPDGIRACYDEGKRCAETLCFDYHRTMGTRVKVIRFFNTYGPYMDPKDGRVVTNFILQALQGEPLTMYGDGTQTRSFCYVDDLIEGMVRMMDTDDSITGPVNLGNPEEYTMNQLASLVLDLTGSSSPIIFKPLPQDDPVRRKPDITLAQSLLDWAPQTPLQAGLLKTTNYISRSDNWRFLRENSPENPSGSWIQGFGEKVIEINP